MTHYEPYIPEIASINDRIAWALCQIIDDDAPMRWTRYDRRESAAERIAGVLLATAIGVGLAAWAVAWWSA